MVGLGLGLVSVVYIDGNLIEYVFFTSVNDEKCKTVIILLPPLFDNCSLWYIGIGISCIVMHKFENMIVILH